ncbi:MAG: Fpg/Nei family DNA glycosylase [Acidobacteria bacterium]|nr:Fpg/Nei family DNA glycosylase [Acidobacteriota bacterium]
MPELPDITIYVEALRARIVGRKLEAIRLASPFLLRTVSPSPREIAGRAVESVARLGKRIVIGLAGDRWIVIHLMIAGRFRWLAPRAKIPGRVGLAAFDFEDGSLILTEAGSKRRASLHLFAGRDGFAALDRGGIEPLDSGLDAFRGALRRESHTVKRALTDPRLVSGIGNSYSDEILHRARMSPMKLTKSMTDEEIARLHRAVIDTLTFWTERLRAETGDRFPEKVTAFRDGMAVHGRFGQPCPDCATPVQRIVYADNETNYCARCQTNGKLLADRALSRLLHDDWPKSIDEVE